MGTFQCLALIQRNMYEGFLCSGALLELLTIHYFYTCCLLKRPNPQMQITWARFPNHFVYLRQQSSLVRSLVPPHCSYDLAIELLPRTTPPRGHVYSLSAPKQKATEEYVAEGLRQGTIRPSSSAAVGFFFMRKKDGGLWPCVDYRGLNKITIKYRHSLPLTNK